ncbi:hypothetical protein HGRIS_000230 [Hohenbuehelia grisea]|uniref:Uncharacterized protein n=1 Tax=Hohenbuehelia grisea TaxID=104357 RepID=A0ABR3JQE6_9AGAR
MPKIRKAVEIIDLTTPPRKRVRHDLDSTSKSQYYSAYLPSSSFDSSASRTPSSFASLTPMDTPSNPLGLRHRQSMLWSLPDQSSFSDHIPLRFQLVQCVPPRSGKGKGKMARTPATSSQNVPKPGEKITINPAITIRHDREGVNRIVQVPRNYTFLHVRRLIMFLFGGIGGESIEIECGDEQDIDVPRTRPKARDDNEPYVFEVFRNIDMYAPKARPGEIREGELWTRLSNAQEARKVEESQSGDTEEEINDFFRGSTALRKVLASASSQAPSTSDADIEECSWKSEDELDLFSIWPKGCNYHSRGIVYRHNASTQIHISVPHDPPARQKCMDNLPRVFSARGLVRLHGVNPRNLGALCPQDELVDSSRDDEFRENLTCTISPDIYNKPFAFQQFYRNAAQLEGHDPPRTTWADAWETPGLHFDDIPATPSMTFGSSSPASAYPYTPSSAQSLRVDTHDFGFTSRASFDSGLSASQQSIKSSPLVSPAVQLKRNLLTKTPFPQTTPQTHHRMRRVEKRIVRDTRELTLKMREALERQAKREAEKRKEKEEKARTSSSTTVTHKIVPLPPLFPTLFLSASEVDAEGEMDEEVDELSDDVDVVAEHEGADEDEDEQADEDEQDEEGKEDEEDEEDEELIDELAETEIAEEVVKRALFPEAFSAPCNAGHHAPTLRPAQFRDATKAQDDGPKLGKPFKLFATRDELKLPSLAPTSSPDPIWMKDATGEWQAIYA